MNLSEKKVTTTDCEELEEYVEIEGTELGEYCDLLLQLRHCDSFMGGELSAALNKEIKEQLSNFKEFSRIVERSEEVKQTIKIKELEWI